jgi:hypothetical protein
MDSQHQPAMHVDWKVSIIPKDAGNATEPTIAMHKELEAVIANPSSLKAPEPVESTYETVEVAPRYNANMPYSPQPIIYSMQDQELMEQIRFAVAHGWKNAHRFASGAVTIGMEAEAVIAGMKQQHMNVQELLKDKEFLKALSSD